VSSPVRFDGEGHDLFVTQPLQLSVVGEPAALANVRRQVQGHLQESVHQSCVDDVKLAVHELVANSIVHGYAGRSPGLVEITVGVATTHIRIRVRDFGHGLYTNPYSPGAGLGRPLLARLAHEVVERQPASGGGHEVILVLARNEASPPSGGPPAELNGANLGRVRAPTLARRR
jgi:anti-sigma regulatory factor (Ser/Thr protein kinase)